MDKKTVDMINKMSFNELKTELGNCHNNPVKEKIIRELMVIRYKQYLQTQAQAQHKLRQRQIRQHQKQMQLQRLQQQESQNKTEDEFDNDTFSIEDDEDEYNKIIEYKKDTTNNNLMDRMNSDMEIKRMKVSTDKKDIVKPFVNTVCDNYATFKNEPGTDIKNFKR
jgi:hypothetical protein